MIAVDAPPRTRTRTLGPALPVADRAPVDPLAALAPELIWLAERGLAIRRPGSTGAPTAAGSVRGPILHVLGADEAPPACGPLEDWVRVPVGRDDLLARAERLLARALPPAPIEVAVADGVVRSGGCIVVLAPQEARLLDALVSAPGQLVGREALVDAVWPEGPPQDPRALDNRIKALRHRLVGLPIRLHTVRGRGVLVELVGSSWS